MDFRKNNIKSAHGGTTWRHINFQKTGFLPLLGSFSTNSSTSQELSFSKQHPDSYLHHKAIDTLSDKMNFGFMPPAPTYPGIQQATEIRFPIPPAPPTQDKMDNSTGNRHTDQSLQYLGVLSKPDKYRQTQEPPKGKNHERKPKALQQDNGKKSRGKMENSDKFKKQPHLSRLERNRLAAIKSNHRKRDEALALASREEQLADQHRQLSYRFDNVREELYRLKTEVLRHSGCDCVAIQQYIAKEAQRTMDDSTCYSSLTAEHGTGTTSLWQNNNGSYSDTVEDIADFFGNISTQGTAEMLTEDRIGDEIMHELLQSFM
ncbi:hypothetical protein FOMG_18726 [Fusarium oxysporum f. sp. melonis 26406]|uniref:BZIP domain-containing protein n=1 Tax=Fusarium oxysporum f. sp. melonis 26406 TaxID=1089452 RepID=W9YZL2_FUSOX|nr:hypothetical protein FOMG_18726 [Fusarium oxysporum f. sp. melonis 26406]